MKQALTIRDQLSGEQFREAVAKALPKHLTPDRFIRVALTALTKTPKLASCDQASFFSQLLTLSQLGLEPDGRRAHLIPFENRKRGVVECQLIVDYKGLVELAQNSGKISNIHADLVCENDVFDYDCGEIKTHRINFRKPRGQAYAVYAKARFKDGSERCEVMTVEDVEKIRQRSKAKDSGPWQTDWNEMAKKTVFRRLSKWLPLSPEQRDALEADDDRAADVVTNGQPPAIFEVAALPESTGAEPEAETPEPEPQPAKKAEAASATMSPQDELGTVIVSAGYTFDQFMRWGIESGNIAEKDAGAWTGFADMPQAIAVRFLRNRVGLIKQLAKAKEEG